jgi:hypothetical protein
MQARVSVTTVFACTLERAFKTPMLCDISKVHTGFGPMPRVTHCTDDARWGQPGGTKRVFSARSSASAGGETALDRVLERVENQRWVIEVTDFKAFTLGFTRFVGEWATTELSPGAVRVDYTYTLHGDAPWLGPAQWLFAQVFWRAYMRRVLENVRAMAYAGEPYQYA